MGCGCRTHNSITSMPWKGGKAPVVVQTPGPKFCSKCGKKLTLTPVAAGSTKFWQVTPCPCSK